MRTKVIVLCLFTLIAIQGCKSQEAELPDGIISQDKMVQIIADIQLIEAAQKQLSISMDKRDKMRDTSYHIVFNKYAVDSTLFDSSLRVYSRHPQIMSEIMENAAAQLNREE